MPARFKNVYQRAVFIILAFLSLHSRAEDWSNAQGPRGDYSLNDDKLLKKIPAAGLKRVWSNASDTKIGCGFSSPVVANGVVYLSDWIPDDGEIPRVRVSNMPFPNPKTGQERLLAFEEKTGKLLWTYSHPVSYTSAYENGPRAAPTVDKDQVYFLGAEGKLVAVKTKSGEVNWIHDLPKEYKAPPAEYGYAGAPLVLGESVYAIAGGADGHGVLAFSRESGALKSKALNTTDAEGRNRQGYAPLTVFKDPKTHTTQILALTGQSLHSLQPETLKENWKVPFETTYGMVGTPPVVGDNRVFVFGMNNLSAAFQLNGDKTPTELWRNTSPGRIDTSTAVAHFEKGGSNGAGTLYGLNSLNGRFIAMDAQNAKPLWKSDALTSDKRGRVNTYATAHMFKNHALGNYYVLNEHGEFMILNQLSADPSQAPSADLAKVKVIDATFPAPGRKALWAPPTIANGRLYVRNDGQLSSFELSESAYTEAELKSTPTIDHAKARETNPEALKVKLEDVSQDIVKLTAEGVLAMNLLMLDHTLKLNGKEIPKDDLEKRKKMTQYQKDPDLLLTDSGKFFQQYTKNELWGMQNHQIAKNSGAPDTGKLVSEAWTSLNNLYDWPERFITQSDQQIGGISGTIAKLNNTKVEVGDHGYQKVGFQLLKKAAGWIPFTGKAQSQVKERAKAVEDKIQTKEFYDFMDSQFAQVSDEYLRSLEVGKPVAPDKDFTYGWGKWHKPVYDNDASLWNGFAKMAMLDYTFFRALGINPDRYKPKNSDGAVELLDVNSKKTLKDYFSGIRDPALRIRAIDLAKKMAAFQKTHTERYGLYRQVKSLLPRFWTYHWEFHPLLLNSESAEEDSKQGTHQ